ncbi:MAG: TSUP family transporter [Actinobacteria bacterium]|nr:TSUP family transporter [Actinomycetota bacterium]
MHASAGSWTKVLAIGLVAGLASGLLGVGGGIVMVPLLTAFVGLDQHRAHATSLAAIVPIAAVGALTFALSDSIDVGLASLQTVFGVALLLMGIRTTWRGIVATRRERAAG